MLSVRVLSCREGDHIRIGGFSMAKTEDDIKEVLLQQARTLFRLLDPFALSLSLLMPALLLWLVCLLQARRRDT